MNPTTAKRVRLVTAQYDSQDSEVLDRQICIVDSRRFVGPGLLRITGAGGIQLTGESASLTLENIDIEWIVDSNTPNTHAAVIIDGGDLRLNNCRIVVRSNETPPAPIPNDCSALRWFASCNNARAITFKQCNFSVDRPEVIVGLLNVFRATEDIEVDETIAIGFWGLFNIHNFGSLSVHRLTAVENRYGGLVAMNGKRLTVSNSIFLRQGCSGTGDGATLAKIEHAIIRNTQFIKNACYGIQILPGAIHLDIASCAFVAGRTLGIYAVECPELATSRHLLVEDCLFIKNGGVGIGVQDFNDTTVRTSYFEDNYGEPHARDLAGVCDQVRLPNCGTATLDRLLTELRFSK